MRIKAREDFVLRQIADEYLLIPVGEAARRINGLLCLSESGFLLFGELQRSSTKADLIRIILREYDVSAGEAEADVDAFLNSLRQFDMLEELQNDEEEIAEKAGQ